MSNGYGYGYIRLRTKDETIEEAVNTLCSLVAKHVDFDIEIDIEYTDEEGEE